MNILNSYNGELFKCVDNYKIRIEEIKKRNEIQLKLSADLLYKDLKAIYSNSFQMKRIIDKLLDEEDLFGKYLAILSISKKIYDSEYVCFGVCSEYGETLEYDYLELDDEDPFSEIEDYLSYKYDLLTNYDALWEYSELFKMVIVNKDMNFINICYMDENKLCDSYTYEENYFLDEKCRDIFNEYYNGICKKSKYIIERVKKYNDYKDFIENH